MAIDNNSYSALKPTAFSYLLSVLVLLVLIASGVYSAYTVEHLGHQITGMNNHIVWGLPHVFAISLIVSASGALNGASLASVFGLAHYKPYARLSVVLAITLLMGGLLVLVLDLGRPDRLIVAMTHYNFRSIFSWNIFLYTGFIVIAVVYLWVMMEPSLNRYTKSVGVTAFVWRIVLTTGTGSIFGFLVGRDALDSAILAPMFIALSLSMGLAALILVMSLVACWRSSPLEDNLVESLGKLLLWFVVGVLYFSIAHHITNLYLSEHQAVERFALGGALAWVFWLGHVLIGTVLPIGLLLTGKANRRGRLLWASVAAGFGGGALIYAIVIGAQSTPQRLFPDKTIIASRFGDAGFALYHPTVWELGLGVGGVAAALLMCLAVLRVLPSTPVFHRQ